MAVPVLDNLSQEQLKITLHPEYSPVWDGRDKNVAYMEYLETLTACGHDVFKPWYKQALKRMQRYACILERFISPERCFPVFGRSMTYRTGVFQPLAMLVLNEQLPQSLSYGQVRGALTQVIEIC